MLMVRAPAVRIADKVRRAKRPNVGAEKAGAKHANTFHNFGGIYNI